MSPATATAVEQRYWARLKPYNPKRGCKMQRCHYLGRVWVGGDGIWDIPEWVEVNAAQAAYLKKLRQSGFTTPQSGNDPRAFDIVTPEMKLEIDHRETELRMRARGIGSASVTALPNFNPAEAKPNETPARRMTMEDLEHMPPPEEEIVEKGDPLLSYGHDDDDDDAIDAIGTPEGAQQITELKPKEVDISGRAAAAEGFEQDGGMDLNADGADVDAVAPAVNDADFKSTSSDPAHDEANRPSTVPAPKTSRSRSTRRGGGRSRGK